MTQRKNFAKFVTLHKTTTQNEIMILSILTIEQIKRFVMVALCSLLAAVGPTSGYVTALIIAWSFNVWAGMRADGVVNIKCHNFSWRKFASALAELILFLMLIELVAVVTYACGDGEEGLYACKTLNYVCIWVYFQNAFKNLCKAQPTNKALWLIYLFIRFDFAKLIRIDSLIEMYDEHLKKQDNAGNQTTITPDNA